MIYLTILLSCVLLINAALKAPSAPKLPPSFEFCKINTPTTEKCVIRAVEGALKTLKSGYAPLKILPLDPLRIVELSVVQGDGPVSIDLTMSDLDITGVSTAKIIKPKIVPQKAELHTKAFIQRIGIKGNYKIDGKILLLPIQGKGLADFVLHKVDASVVLKGRNVTKHGDLYYQVDDFQFDFAPKKMDINLQGLFNGNKELEQNMNKFLNENSQEILGELKGAISQALSQAFSSVANKIFQSTPSTVIFP